MADTQRSSFKSIESVTFLMELDFLDELIIVISSLNLRYNDRAASENFANVVMRLAAMPYIVQLSAGDLDLELISEMLRHKGWR